ncbi:MAG: 50S ribosomal protein L29 [Bacteroidota bacterium]
MKIHELRELPDKELTNRLQEEQENLANLFFQKATSQLESPIKIRTVRRTIARMKTILRAREIKTANETAAVKKPAN